jgi:hypothetical protein
MGRGLLFGAVLCAILFAAATTRSDVASPTASPQTAPVSQPTPSTTLAGSTAAKDPFAPFDVGPPESVWPYESLTPAERAVIDRGRAESGWQQTHDTYGAAAMELSRRARAEAAEHDLGVANLDSEGVVQ